MKRLFDIVFSLFALIILLPVFLIVAVVVIIDSGFPVFFLQDRVGKDNKLFKIVKFRTMKTDAPIVARSDLKDPKKYVTRVGKYLRKYGLDELPQIFNVIKGQMSFVGPRPLLACEEPVHRMRKDLGIYTIPPGITGLCQIVERDVNGAYRRVSLDFEYFCKKSIAFDICILFWTVFPRRLTLDTLIGDM